MPFKLVSTATIDSDQPSVPATNSDKALLLRSNTHTPGIRGLLNIPDDAVFKLFILFATFFTYVCVIVDFTLAMGSREDRRIMKPFQLGSFKDYIFCFDVVYLIDMLLRISQKAHRATVRQIILVAIDIVTFIPYEVVYVVIMGRRVLIFFALRLRYIFRFLRCIESGLFSGQNELSMTFVLIMYLGFLICACLFITCIRIHIMCQQSSVNEVDIHCANLTTFDFSFTYVIVSGQLSYSSILFMGANFCLLNFFDGVIQIFVITGTCALITKLTYIAMEKNGIKYHFCLTAYQVMSSIRALKGAVSGSEDPAVKEEYAYLQSNMREYMGAYWMHYQLEKLNNPYIGDHRVATIPSVIQSEITLDVTWNMFKHSKLFQSESNAFLRRVAKLGIFTFSTKNDVICEQGIFRSRMIYVIKGIMSLMSEQTGRTPILSFSGGTCIGELALFLNVPASTTIVCNTYCEYIVLSRVSFIDIRRIYPETYDKLRRTCMNRVRRAANFDFLNAMMYKNKETSFFKSQISMRFIKAEICLQTQRKKQNLMSEISIPPQMRADGYPPSAKFNASYIPLYVMADELESNQTTHFTITGWNFKLKPTSQLYLIWNYLICVLTLIDNLAYPLYGCSKAPLFSIVYDNFVVFVQIMYAVDFVGFNFVAVVDRDRLLVTSEQILMHKVQYVSFWIDLLTAIPLDLLFELMEGPLQPNIYRILGITRLLKMHKVMSTSRREIFFVPVYLIISNIARSTYAFLELLFFAYLVFEHFNYFALCGYEEETFATKLAFLYQFYFSMNDSGIILDRRINLLPLAVLQKVAMVTFTLILCNNAASVYLLLRRKINLNNQIQYLRRIVTLYGFSNAPRKTTEKYLNIYQNTSMTATASYDKEIFQKMLGTTLYKIHRSLMLQTFVTSLSLFWGMSRQTVKSFCELGFITVVPRNEIIVMAGAQVSHVYFIMDGTCAYIATKRSKRLLNLYKGAAILLLEYFFTTNAINNVITVTDCQLYCVSVVELTCFMVRYNAMKCIREAMRETCSVDTLESLRMPKPHVVASFNDDESRRYFVHRMDDFKATFGIFKRMHIFCLRYTFTPFGRFWFCWEVAHFIVTYMYCFLGCIPFTISCQHLSTVYWIFRCMDAFYLCDLYLRAHVVYFEENKIEVHHPRRTSMHFVKTSFLPDLIATIPLELLVMPMMKRITMKSLICLRLNRYIRLYRYLGLRLFIKNSKSNVKKLDVLSTYVAFSLLFCNLFVVLIVYDNIEMRIVNMQATFTNVSQSFWDTYLDGFHAGIHHWFNLSIFAGYRKMSVYIWPYILIHLAGILATIVATCLVIAMSIFPINHLMTYQTKMRRLVTFMDIRKIDKTVRNTIIQHFEYLWKLREGKSLTETIRIFNDRIGNEILYSYYAPVFQNASVLASFPKAIIKDLLCSHEFSHKVVLKTGIILRLNDINAEIYVLSKGSVEILGPDYNFLRELNVGSVFGCMDDVPANRSTLTYVAQTHCEFLVMRTLHFHNVLRTYPQYYNLYSRVMKNSNLDYIPCRFSKLKPEATIKNRTNIHWKHLRKTLTVMKHRNWVEIAYVILYGFGFFWECMLIASLHRFFNITIFIAYFIDALSISKLYIDFSTAYEDIYGFEITSRKQIALRYMGQFMGFPYHVLVNIPFEVLLFPLPSHWIHVDLSLAWAMMRSNRLFKILLVYKYVRSLRQRLNVNIQLVRTIHTVLTTVVVQHICIIFMANLIFRDEPMPYISALFLHVYLISQKLYTPFGYASPELVQTNVYQVTYICILLITNVTCIVMLGDCVATYRMQNFSRYQYKVFCNNQDYIMGLMDVSKPLRDRVNAYSNDLAASGYNVEYPLFVTEAPFYLREAVMNSMFGVHLRRHPIFKQCHMDFVRQVAANLKVNILYEGNFICFHDDIDYKLYFVHSGEVEGIVEDNLYYEISDSKFIAGDYFGFHQLIHECTGHYRTYKIVSSKAIILSLRRSDVLSILEFFPASKYVFFNSGAHDDDLHNAEVEYRDYLRHTKGIHE